jgi:hypothetical protein
MKPSANSMVVPACILMVLCGAVYARGTGQQVAGSRSPEERAALELKRDAANAPPDSVPDGPDHWIPVIADVKVSEGGRQHFERFYRNSDGSTRVEVTHPLTGETVVTIHNLAQETSYALTSGGQWGALPLIDGIRRLPPRNPRVSRQAQLTSSPETVQGIAVYRLIEGNSVQYLAPELNYLDIKAEVVTKTAGGDELVVRELFNIVATAPSSDLFWPPAGAPVRQASSIKDLLAGPR